MSDGTKVENPKYLPKYQKKLARAQCRLSRTMLRSKNHKKQHIRIARIHEHIRNMRRDTLQKLTT